MWVKPEAGVGRSEEAWESSCSKGGTYDSWKRDKTLVRAMPPVTRGLPRQHGPMGLKLIKTRAESGFTAVGDRVEKGTE